MREIEEKILNICKRNDLSIFPNIRENVMIILESAEPTKEENLKPLISMMNISMR